MRTDPATTSTKPPASSTTPISPIPSLAPGSNLLTTSMMAHGIWERMPAVMMSETPLPMPCLSICSPSHIRKTVPAVSEQIAMSHQSGFELHQGCTSPPAPVLARVMNCSHAIDWTMHRPIVAYLVHSWIFCWPEGPSSLSFFSAGTTELSSWKMIAAEM